MHDFHYIFIKKNFDDELLFTDTDILTYEIRKCLWSFSGKICLTYSNDSKFFNETNKNVICKMKDEFGGVIVNEFVGLKSKIYSIKKLMLKNVIQQKE